MTLRDRFHALVESHLPWYDARLEQGRNGRTEAIRLRAIMERKNVERVLEDYRRAAKRVGP